MKSDTLASRLWHTIRGSKAKILDMRLMVMKARPADRAALMQTFSQGADGLLCWLNLCGWVFEPRNRERKLPFITWPIQDRAAVGLHRAIGVGNDVAIDKSRDMGASWLCLSVMDWFWLFERESLFKLVSRNEDLVDKPADPDTLFWKLDFLNNNLPSWMQPGAKAGKDRTHMRLVNPRNGSIFTGESTNQDVGKGGRQRAILLDEFGAVLNGGAILSATSDTAPCRIFNSTPNGWGSFDDKKQLRGNAFAAIRFSNAVQIISLPWWEHPEKGKGAHLAPDANGKMKWTSPWYEKECVRRASRREIAENLDMDYLGSGSMFFDSEVLTRIRAACRPADKLGELRFDVRTYVEGQSYRVEKIRFEETDRGHLQLWCPLALDDKGELRPPQDHTYVGFCDISAGNGASNSRITICDVDLRASVGAFTCPNTSPEQLARTAVALCKWFRGQTGFVYLGWEANFDGGPFGREVLRLGYYYVLGNSNPAYAWNPTDGKVGWYSGREKKRYLLTDLRSAWARGELNTFDSATVDEAGQYTTYSGGGIGPSGLTEEDQGARAAHGDRVIAEAGCVMMLREQVKSRPPEKAIPKGSPAARKRWWRREKAKSQEETW
jgi:hypothetical protein